MASLDRASTPTKVPDVVENVENMPRPPKTTANGIVLVPQPTDDPKDPLVCLSSCNGLCILCSYERLTDGIELAYAEKGHEPRGDSPGVICL